MKKSILQRMAAAESRTESPVLSDASDKPSLARRHSSPVISNVGRALTQLTEDSVISLDPDRIDRSPYRDRFGNDEDAAKSSRRLRFQSQVKAKKFQFLFGRIRRERIITSLPTVTVDGQRSRP